MSARSFAPPRALSEPPAPASISPSVGLGRFLRSNVSVWAEREERPVREFEVSNQSLAVSEIRLFGGILLLGVAVPPQDAAIELPFTIGGVDPFQAQGQSFRYI